MKKRAITRMAHSTNRAMPASTWPSEERTNFLTTQKPRAAPAKTTTTIKKTETCAYKTFQKRENEWIFEMTMVNQIKACKSQC